MSKPSILAELLIAIWQTLRARRRRGPLVPSWSLQFEIAVTLMRRFSIVTSRLPPSSQRALWKSVAPSTLLTVKVRREEVVVDGVPCEWFVPRAILANEPTTLLYFHGGSFVNGSTRTHRELLCRIALAAGIRVLGVNYRLSPEHRFPAATHDAYASYCWLVDGGIDPARLVVGGDSAGGNLALATLSYARDNGLPLPAAAVLICPWVDLTARGGSIETNKTYDWIEPRMLSVWTELYVGSMDTQAISNPQVSPTFAELGGLPPLLIQVGADEMLFDQVASFAKRAETMGVDTTLSIWPDMIHNWHMLTIANQESAKAIDEITEFISSRTGRASQRPKNRARAAR